MPEDEVDMRNRLEVPSALGLNSSSSSLERDEPIAMGKTMRSSWEILADHVGRRDSLLSPPPPEHGEEPSFQEIKKVVKNNPEMNKLRTGMESQLAALDDRLKMQEKEVEDVMDIVKKRAEIEKRYGKELEGLARQMRHKHKEMMANPSGGSSVSQLKIVLPPNDQVILCRSIVPHKECFQDNIYPSIFIITIFMPYKNAFRFLLTG